MTRVAINGFGRIGRLVLRIGLQKRGLKFVAINDTHEPRILAHLFANDTIHGKYPAKVTYDDHHLIINGRKIPITADREPENLPWKKLKVDVVAECTGHFRTKELASKHLKAGAKKVLISAPAKSEVDFEMLYGINHKQLKRTHRIVANQSCTTNCLAPVLDVLHKAYGIRHGFVQTIHAYTSTQRLIDNANKDLRRARAAALNIIPTTTGAAIATTKILPELHGKMDAIAYRVPVACGSVIDLVCEVDKHVTIEEVNALFKQVAKKQYKGVIEYSEEELVSSDIISNPYSAIYDALSTRITGDLLKVVVWYDNEYGFSARMVDVLKLM